MATMTEMVSQIHAEDRELIEQLAKVRNIHNQIRDLRQLLPSALLDPARQAVETPGNTSPRDVAFRISKAVQKGREDFQALKKAWHDEKMKQLLQESTSTDLMQGIDAWTVDYQALLSASKPSSSEILVSDDIALESIDEAKAAIERSFNSESKLQISIASNDAESPFPLTVEVARLRFQILREDNQYSLQLDKPDKLTKQVSMAINATNKSTKKIENLLQLLEAYDDIRRRYCDICADLVDSNFDVPFIRRRAENAASEGTDPKWLAYHSGCAP